jgi:hypothetical protein
VASSDASLAGARRLTRQRGRDCWTLLARRHRPDMKRSPRRLILFASCLTSSAASCEAPTLVDRDPRYLSRE